jgi:hypothetical protein
MSACRFVVILGALLLGACANLSALIGEVPAGERVVIEGSLAVRPTRTWSKVSDLIPDSKATVWTMDGINLDKLHFVAGLRDDEPINGDRPGRAPEPRFHSSMSATDVMELFASSVARQGGSRAMVKTWGLRPEKFAGTSGFRFDFTLVDQADEVERRGLAVGAVHEGRLFLIFYHGAKIHYFAKNVDEVEAVIRSARLESPR